LPPGRCGQRRLPDDPPVDPGDREAILAAIADWYHWCERLASQPVKGVVGWDAERLEYRFAVSARTSQGEAVLAVSEYAEGRLDWPAFTLAADTTLGPGTAETPPTRLRRVAIPNPITYPGMPAPRWWEMEDARVDLGAIDAGPTDLARLLLLEFATVFGNDWFTLPVAGVRTGSLVRIEALRVVDTFGEETIAAPFGGDWRMFHLSGADGDTLLLAPTVAGTTEAAPVEEVLFLRDELANLAWAVERTVLGAAGRPLRRQEADTDPPRAEPPAGGGLAYRLATDVPAHWIPLVRETFEGSPRLARAALRRPRPDGTLERLEPVGRILEPERPQLRIHDHEVPREGVTVTRAWQLARDPVGGTHLWMGRRKTPGRREGSSGLRFDVIEPGPP
jgi:hypothetical protein